MFATQSNKNPKAFGEGKPQGADAATGKDSTEPNPVWQSLALRPAAIQPKLAISQPDDPYEREAEEVADQVLRMPDQPSSRDRLPVSAASLHQSLQYNQDAGEVEDLHSKEPRRNEDFPDTAPQIVHEALNSPGQPLDPTARDSMETRFGQDFSQVRIHTGLAAESAARTIQARAFTLSSKVVFAPGEYRPGTVPGQRLLAHELAHTLQQSQTSNKPSRDGPLRAPQPIAIIQRQHDGGTTPPVKENPAAEKKEEKKDEVAEIAATIIAAVNPTFKAKPLLLKTQWKDVESQIKSPKANSPRGKNEKFTGLYDKDLVTKLTSLSADKRTEVQTKVFDDVVAAVSTKLGDSLTREVLQKEFDETLSKRMRGNIESKFVGFVVTRSLLISTFGTWKTANGYYDTLVAADFPSAVGSGHNLLVHPNLKVKLDKAKEVLKKKGETAAGSVGGFNIRENRNDTSKLSLHSFGWAIDIDATMNPNIESSAFPKTLVEGITGTDVYGGVDATTARGTGTSDDKLASAQALKTASDTFKAAFQSEAAFKTAMATYLTKTTKATLTDEQLTELVTELEAQRVKASKKRDLSAIATYINDRIPKPTTTTPATTPVPATTTPATTTPAKPTVSAEATAAAKFVFSAYELYKATYTTGSKRVAASTGGTAAIAMHGFINLAPELIAALTGSDGGNLKWLGAVASGTKDFMHFELQTADQPTLPKGTQTDKAPDSGAGGKE